jgi:hypothetical protein
LTDSKTDPADLFGLYFGASDADNGWAVTFSPDSDLELFEFTGGSKNRRETIQEAGGSGGAYDVNEWWGFEVDFDTGRTTSLSVSLLDDTGDPVATFTRDITLKGDGIGMYGRKGTASTDQYLDYIVDKE